VERKALDSSGALWMVLLCMVFGLHQVAIKAVAHDMAPILQITIRSGISAALVSLFMLACRQAFLVAGTMVPGLVVGALFSVEFICVAEGLSLTSASHMSVFLYTAPVFTSFILHWLQPAERLRPAQWGGILLAFIGIALAFAGGSLHSGISAAMLLGDLLGLMAGIGWALTTVVIRCSKLAVAPPTLTLLYQLVAAFFVLACYSAWSGQADRFTLSGLVWGSVLYQGVLVSFAAYLGWFSLLRHYNVSQLSSFLFLSPLFGVTFGVLLLHEAMDFFFIIGAVFVLAGISLVSWPRKAKKMAECVEDIS